VNKSLKSRKNQRIF